MDKWQEDIIRKLKPQLIRRIHCNVLLLASLESMFILTSDEVQELSSNPSELQKVNTLLDLLVRKTNGYNALIEALEKTEQSGALDLLQTSIRKSLNSQYKYLPEGVEEFLEESSTGLGLKVLIISTLNCDITTDKIRENLEISYELQKVNDFGGFKVTKCEFHVITHVKNIPELFLRLKKLTGSLVVVTEVETNSLEEILKHIQFSVTTQTQIISDYVKWDHLTNNFQKELLLRKVIWQKLKIPLAQSLIVDEDGAIFEKKLEGSFLADIINHKIPTLIDCNLPPQLSYYISRRLRSRRTISTQILKAEATDIFVLTGIERNQLSCLVGKEKTDNSQNQIRNGRISVRFIVLVLKTDFENICDLTDKPVHLFSFCDDKKLNWIRSKGSVSLIQKHLGKDQNEYGEEDVVDFPEKRNDPICISDSPGMGKSTLLSTIGYEILDKGPTHVVIFVEVSKFLECLKSANVDGDSILEIIVNFISNSDLSKDLLMTGLKAGKLNATLLFDGLDEVYEFKGLIFEAILQLRTSFSTSLNVFVTTRPHLLNELENTFQTMGYTIPPFEEKDQVQFLTSYWSNWSTSCLDTRRLNCFALNCVQMLNTSLKDEDKQIAGIPLQCFLIAELYKMDAVNYSDSTNTVPSQIPDIEPIASLTDLYKLMINKKIAIFEKKYPNKGSPRSLMLAHVYEAVKLIFSTYFTEKWHLFQKLNWKRRLHETKQDTMITSYFNRLSGFFHSHIKTDPSLVSLTAEDNISVEDLLAVGILECSGPTSSPKFLHRTFAEYFVAWFSIEILSQKMYSEFLFSQVFRKQPESKSILVKGYSTSAWRVEVETFSEETVTQFINSLLSPAEPLPVLFSKEDINLSKFLEACAISNRSNLWKLFFACSTTTENILVFDEQSVLLAVRFSSPEIIQKVIDIFEAQSGKGIDTIVFTTLEYFPSILHVAASRGDFSVMELLLKKDNLCQQVYNGVENIENCIWICVNNTVSASQREVQERMEIIAYLLHQNETLVKKNKIPVLTYSHVHYLILKFLISHGMNIVLCNFENVTVLHSAPTYMTAEEYHEIISSIFPPVLEKLLNIKSKHVMYLGYTPLHYLLEFLDPLEDTLELLIKSGANFNSDTGFGITPLHVAIRHKRSLAVLKNLVRLGTKLESGIKLDAKMICIAAETEQIDVLKFLISNGVTLNSPGYDKSPPLHQCLEELMVKGEIVNILLDAGADPNVGDEVENNCLHLSAKHCDVEIVTLILAKGVSVNSQNFGGQTPLHFAVLNKCDSNAEEIVKFLLDHGANPEMADKKNSIPLDFAVLRDTVNSNIVQLLASGIDREIVFNHLIRDVCTPEQLKVVMETLNISVNQQDKDGNTFLHRYAPRERQSTTVQFLLEVGADVNLKNKENRTPVEYAVRHVRNLEIRTLELLEMYGAVLSVELMSHALSFVLYNFNEKYGPDSHENLLNWYLIRGAVVNIKYGNGWTLLHEVVKCGQLYSVKFVLKNGGIVNAVEDDAGNIPLHTAFMSDCSDAAEIVRLLVNSGGDMKAVNFKNQTPLELALELDIKLDLETIQLLDSKLPWISKDEGTVLLRNLFNEEWDTGGMYKNMAQKYFDAGADIHVKNKKGHGLLKIGMTSGCTAGLGFLIEKNVEVEHNLMNNGDSNDGLESSEFLWDGEEYESDLSSGGESEGGNSSNSRFPCDN